MFRFWPDVPFLALKLESWLLKTLLILGASAALLLLFLSGSFVQAQNVVLNNTFELQNLTYWTKTGNLDPGFWGMDKFDTTGNGAKSWCFWQSPSSGKNGGITQTIFLIAGLTYDFSVRIAYDNH